MCHFIEPKGNRLGMAEPMAGALSRMRWQGCPRRTLKQIFFGRPGFRRTEKRAMAQRQTTTFSAELSRPVPNGAIRFRKLRSVRLIPVWAGGFGCGQHFRNQLTAAEVHWKPSGLKKKDERRQNTRRQKDIGREDREHGQHANPDEARHRNESSLRRNTIGRLFGHTGGISSQSRQLARASPPNRQKIP